MKSLNTPGVAAIVAVFLSGTAFAQDATDTAPDATDSTDATGEVLAVEEPGTPPEGTIILQGKDSLLAGDMIGTRVFNEESQNVGKIADLIIGLDGTVDGVVIGVGGFLGMGEKPVAIEIDKISVGQTDTGSPRLILAATRQDLEAADTFVTVQEQRAAEQSLQIQEEAQNADIGQ